MNAWTKIILLQSYLEDLEYIRYIQEIVEMYGIIMWTEFTTGSLQSVILRSYEGGNETSGFFKESIFLSAE